MLFRGTDYLFSDDAEIASTHHHTECNNLNSPAFEVRLF